MKPRRRILLKAVIVVLLLIGVFLWFVHYRGRSALERYKRQLVAAGEKLTVEEHIPKPSDEGQKAAAVFSKATFAMNGSGVLSTNYPPSMRMVVLGRAMIGWQQPDIRDSEATNAWDDIRVALETEAAAFELLQRFRGVDGFDDNLDYSQGFSTMSPSLPSRKRAVQHLSAAVLLNLHDGNSAGAATNLQMMLTLVNGWRDERLLISQLVRFAMASITLSANWELLQSPNVTEGQLALLQRDWQKLDFELSAERAMQMERAMAILTADEMRRSGRFFDSIASPAWMTPAPAPPSDDGFAAEVWQFTKDSLEKAKNKGKHVAWKTVWADQDQLAALKGMQVLLESLRQARTNGYSAAFQARDDELRRLGLVVDAGEETIFAGEDGDVRHVLSRGAVGANYQIIGRVLRMEAARQMMITAIAVKRFQIAKGHLPQSVSEVSPDFVENIPLDPIDQKPLRYRPNQDGGFLLYSIGEDRVDDGGDPKPKNEGARSRAWQNGRDWVFPQPASEAQIADYYKELAKNR